MKCLFSENEIFAIKSLEKTKVILKISSISFASLVNALILNFWKKLIRFIFKTVLLTGLHATSYFNQNLEEHVTLLSQEKGEAKIANSCGLQ